MASASPERRHFQRVSRPRTITAFSPSSVHGQTRQSQSTRWHARLKRAGHSSAEFHFLKNRTIQKAGGWVQLFKAPPVYLSCHQGNTSIPSDRRNKEETACSCSPADGARRRHHQRRSQPSGHHQSERHRCRCAGPGQTGYQVCGSCGPEPAVLATDGDARVQMWTVVQTSAEPTRALMPGNTPSPTSKRLVSRPSPPRRQPATRHPTI